MYSPFLGQPVAQSLYRPSLLHPWPCEKQNASMPLCAELGKSVHRNIEQPLLLQPVQHPIDKLGNE
ncbi:Uncharacterised protein [Vibrio cholerae]|nr:Uncharacterised protein [Vibrio cholerae]